MGWRHGQLQHEQSGPAVGRAGRIAKGILVAHCLLFRVCYDRAASRHARPIPRALVPMSGQAVSETSQGGHGLRHVAYSIISDSNVHVT